MEDRVEKEREKENWTGKVFCWVWCDDETVVLPSRLARAVSFGLPNLAPALLAGIT